MSLHASRRAVRARHGDVRWRVRSTSWWSSPSCWPATRSAIPPGGRCTSTARPGCELGRDRELPSIYVIQGFTGQLDMWLSRSAFEPTFVERLDAMFAAGDCPDAVIVFVDAWTSRGGSQFLNSAGTGPLHGLPLRRGGPVHRRALSDERRPRPSRAERQVVGRLRRDGRADAATGRVRRARVARGRRAVRVLLPARVPARRRGPCAITSTARGRCSRALGEPPTTSTSTGSAPRSRCYAMRVLLLARSATARGRRCSRSRSRPAG